MILIDLADESAVVIVLAQAVVTAVDLVTAALDGLQIAFAAVGHGVKDVQDAEQLALIAFHIGLGNGEQCTGVAAGVTLP